MTFNIASFDLTTYDSAIIDGSAPGIFANKLALMLEELICSVEESVLYSEFKLRAAVDILVTGNLKAKNNSAELTKLQEKFKQTNFLIFIDEPVKMSSGLTWLRAFDQIIVFLPKLQAKSENIQTVLDDLNDLSSIEGLPRQWIIDLSILQQVPFALLGFLLGMHKTSSRQGKELSLVWVKRDGLPKQLLPAVESNFNMLKKGSFLLSK